MFFFFLNLFFLLQNWGFKNPVEESTRPTLDSCFESQKRQSRATVVERDTTSVCWEEEEGKVKKRTLIFSTEEEVCLEGEIYVEEKQVSQNSASANECVFFSLTHTGKPNVMT